MNIDNEDNSLLFFRIAKVALENKVSSRIVCRELDLSEEELDRLYLMILEKLS